MVRAHSNALEQPTFDRERGVKPPQNKAPSLRLRSGPASRRTPYSGTSTLYPLPSTLYPLPSTLYPAQSRLPLT